jgi:membrane protease YdiL (CAAX protease family)
MGKRKSPIRVASQVVVFVALFCGAAFVLGYVLGWLAEELAGRTFAVLLGALFASWLTLRIFEGIPLREIGLWWSRNSMDNLAFGLAGGAGAACLALTPPLLTGTARIVFHHPPDYSTFIFALVCVAAGSMGEELLFRGYGFQLLLASLGPWATLLPVGVVFGLMHGANPGASSLGVINTVGFGILFGYAYLRSRDLWLPIGLHVGWNVVLPLFGADLSGSTMFRELSGHELTWRAGALWSGGNYGPEASLLTSAALIPLAVYLWKAPIRRQFSPLTDRPAEDVLGAPAPPSQS